MTLASWAGGSEPYRPSPGGGRYGVLLAVLIGTYLSSAVHGYLRMLTALATTRIATSSVITFGLWYWDLDRGGAAARARGSGHQPAFIFPEMTNAQYMAPGWYPKFLDYLYLSFTTAAAFSPTDVSAIRPWAKLMMMAEEVISLLVAILVVSRAVNILK